MKELIVCKDLNGAIGYNGQLLCHLPNDLKRFKEITLGKTVIMGRKTWESLPLKPLPDRENMVISSSLVKGAPIVRFSGHFIHDDFLNTFDNPIIIGGSQVYRTFINDMDILHVTEIQHRFENADTYFPHIDISIWEETERIINKPDDKHEYEYHYITYKKRCIRKLKYCYVVTHVELGWDCVLGVYVTEDEETAKQMFSNNHDGWNPNDECLVFHNKPLIFQ